MAFALAKQARLLLVPPVRGPHYDATGFTIRYELTTCHHHNAMLPLRFDGEISLDVRNQSLFARRRFRRRGC